MIQHFRRNISHGGVLIMTILHEYDHGPSGQEALLYFIDLNDEQWPF
jgi:hypothetical protein